VKQKKSESYIAVPAICLVVNGLTADCVCVCVLPAVCVCCTGLGIWPAAVLLSRWLVEKQDLLRGKVVVELGAGCGLPALAAGKHIHIV
jgi:Lysine methyltransferase